VTLFFTWGFLTSLNDVLVADLRSIFRLSYRSATLVQFTFFFSCFAFSFPSSRLVARFGYKSTMMVGLTIMAAGSLCFVGATAVAVFGCFLLALAVMACGSAALQTAAGPYVSLLGSEESASSRFSIALGINSFGAMLAPAFGSVFILHSQRGSHLAQIGELVLPFVAIAAGLACLAAVLACLRLPAIEAAAPIESNVARGSYRVLLQHPRLIFGVLAMLLYVGAEIGIGSLLINFLGQPDTSGLTPQRAALWASFYGGGAMAGRLLAPLLFRRYRPQRVLSVAAVLAIALVAIAILFTGPLASCSLVAVGLCNSVMVPILFTTSIAGLGPLTGKGSGLLVGALIGGALLPVLQGAAADRIGLHRSFAIPAVCYLAILAYGVYTSGFRQEHSSEDLAATKFPT
jgi:FHS family L-fucose permease-like MFS transporter